MTLYLGADPEIFLNNRGTPFFPTKDMCSGTKEQPAPLGGGRSIQIDGTALEFNTKPVMADSFTQEIINARSAVKRFLPKDVDISHESTRIWDPDNWNRIEGDQKELGCNPDFNAYTRKENPRPDPEAIGKPTMRTAGGHIHVGWNASFPITEWRGPDHFLDCVIVTKVLDAVLIPASKLWDDDEERAKLYGAPGAFRPKPFGVEYRPLSNRWFTHPKSYSITNFIKMYVNAIEYDLFYSPRYNEVSPDIYDKLLESSSIAETEAVLDKYLNPNFNTTHKYLKGGVHYRNLAHGLNRKDGL